jgi:hypothetical protein
VPGPMPEESAPEAGDRRWHLLRNVLVFQMKLAVDALRDFVLSPLSLGAALLDLATGTDREPLYFEQILALGRRSEGWINLFGREPDAGVARNPGIDRLVERMESLVIEQYERGGITAQAKAAIDRSLDAVATGRRPEPPPGH